jgi:hypothetical protein
MSVYAVYARAPKGAVWSLRDLFSTPEEADQYANAAVNEVQADGSEPAAAAVVVEWEQRDDVPAHLPEQWVAPVISRYGEPDPTEADRTGAPGRS